MAEVPKCADLARRAVACPRWRWMPGMLAWWRLDPEDESMALRLHGWLDDYPTDPDDDEPIYPGHLNAAHDTGAFGFPRDAGIAPDLTDPATLGCLLAVVRDAWGDPLLRVEGFPDGSRVVSHRLTRIVGLGPTEAAALVAALESAP